MSESISAGVLDLLVVQPTPFCNLDCDYCYLPFRQSKEQITSEVLEQVFRRTFESSTVGDHFTVVWHAGEPLVLPIAFYRNGFDIIRRCNLHGIEVNHSFQTNGTLVTAEWCDFIHEHHLRIGVSIDGPEFLHDQHRKTRSGRGTWSQVIRGITTLNEHQVPFHVITVLTRESLDHADEIFEFYRQHQIRQIGFNIEEIEGVNRSSSLLGDHIGERVTAFLSRFYDLVERSSERFFVREFQSAIGAIMSGGLMENAQAQQTTPFAIISVDCRGKLYGRFRPSCLD